jgi:fructosamine-3-kinase
VTHAELARALERDLGLHIAGVSAVGGGCVSPAWRVECRDGGVLFVKSAPSGAAPEMLHAEARSLRRIARTRSIRVPSVAQVTDEWLALEWLEPSPPDASAWSALGRDLARLHDHRDAEHGWSEDNFIGPLPQRNEPTADWPTFWRERRLAPQLRRAAGVLSAADVARCERVLAGLDELLAGVAVDGASLLHGDLWNGNVHFTEGGGALIDPSSHYGHREVDLAMAALFGGFPSAFFAAYEAEWPLLPGAAARRPVYQLYYLLVHVNLFGAGYVAQTRRAAEAALASLGQPG